MKFNRVPIMQRPLWCLVAALVLTACSTRVPLQRAQTDAFRLGDSPQTIQAKLGSATPLLEHNFAHRGAEYRAQHFNLQTGTQQSSTVVCTPVCIFIPIYIPIYTPFVVVYNPPGGVVRAYGTLEELSKSTDDEVADFMPVLKESMQQALAQKKKGVP